MTVENVQEILRRDGHYETPIEDRPAKPARLGAITTWRFSKAVMGTILESSRLTRCGCFDAAGWARATYPSWHKAETLGAVITVEGFGAVHAVQGPVVYSANHMSMLETIILPIILLAHSPLSIVLKESLLSYPFLGGPLRSSHPIAVTRKNVRDDLRTVLEEGKARLAAGRSVLIFPQAARRSVFDAVHFNTLGDKLARAAGVPLVPVALQTDFQAMGRVIKDFGRVDPSRPIRFAFGPALADTGTKGERHRQCVAFVEGKLHLWGLPVATKGTHTL